MGAETNISLINVSKHFNRYDRPLDRLKEIILPRKNYTQNFWALRDISFEVMRGETMGIIGRNGSGKSTLLQIICGTLTPTSGEVTVNGRVAALLELGAGFNPEFTGRENVYMNSAIMGLSRVEVNERFDDIAAFADIRDFIDQPVKTYSSGMYVRLAFSAAIHISPEILIVDEALAVGDMFFQAKCMAQMRRMIDDGVTVLFVSHDIGSVKSLCKSCLFLEDGNIRNIGKSEFVVNQYLKKSRHKPEESLTPIATVGLEIENSPTKSSLQSINLKEITEEFPPLDNSGYGSKQALIKGYRFLDSNGDLVDHFQWGEQVTIQVLAHFITGSEDYSIGFLLRDVYGLDIFGTNLNYEQDSVIAVKSGQMIIAGFSFKLLLQPNTYTLTLAVSLINEISEEIICDWHDNIFTFKITKLNSLTPETKVYIPTETEVRIVT
jgi:ABC-type polysaccharide/polyol phosphate transport system ATPase subunit